jgi:TfoX/Sxy family transcriptional regulator of competence genes
MAYDAGLAKRVLGMVGDQPDLTEKKMFGGIGYLLQGNMACGVHGENLIVRVGPEQYREALAQPGARPFDLTGRAMTGWVQVGPDGYAAEESLRKWVELGIAFALSLPAK